MDRLQPFRVDGDLHDHVGVPRRELPRLGDQVIGLARDALGGNRAIDDGGDLLDALAVADPVFLREEAGIGGDPGDDAVARRRADLVDGGGIEEELHAGDSGGRG
ncbi:MAG: hypothetical protein AMXMBFR80_27740 [Dehalococcoidia bacterium]